MTALRMLAMLGATILIATFNGIFSGIVSVIWGDQVGCIFGAVGSTLVTTVALWQWTGRLGE